MRTDFFVHIRRNFSDLLDDPIFNEYVAPENLPVFVLCDDPCIPYRDPHSIERSGLRLLKVRRRDFQIVAGQFHGFKEGLGKEYLESHHYSSKTIPEGITLTSITFLGTGGGRFATIYQVRNTGGIYIKESARIHIDPGPGALVAMKKLSIDPAKTDAILISHCHPDHYTDAEMLIEGMTFGGFGRRGTVIGSRSVIEGKDGFGPAISRYHRSLPESILSLEPGDKVSLGGILIEAAPTIHSDPTGIGFRFHTSSGVISYVSDSEIGEEVIRAHRGSRVIILCVTRPLGSGIPYHMSTDDAAEFVKSVRPEIVLLTHFGMRLLNEGAEKQAEYIEKESEVKTIAMTDYSTFHIGKDMHTSEENEHRD